MSSHLYTPSLASLPKLLETSTTKVNLTMSLNIFAYGISTLLYGPLSERFGRRPILLCGLVGFTVSSLLCSVSQNVEELIIFRIIQGASSAVEGVIVFAIIRDIFKEDEQVRIIALYGIVTALAPVVAPIIGGYLIYYFGWRGIFFLLTVLGISVTIVTWIFFIESLQRKLSTLSFRIITEDYFYLLKNMEFVRYCLITGASMGTIFAFISLAPFLFINKYGLSIQLFGYIQGFIISGHILGSLLARFLTKYISHKTIFNFAFRGYILSSIVLFLVTHYMETTLILTSTMFVIAFFNGPIFATTPILAMSSSEQRTGSTSSMLIAIELTIGAICIFCAGAFYDNSSKPLGIVALVLVLFSIAMSQPKLRGAHL